MDDPLVLIRQRVQRPIFHSAEKPCGWAPKDGRVVPLLVRTLEGSNLEGTYDENERYMAARALGRIGPAAKPAVPELLKLIRHHDAALAHTHVALDDAMEQGAVFCSMFTENNKNV